MHGVPKSDRGLLESLQNQGGCVHFFKQGWVLVFLIALSISCGGRKDVNRRGEIKLRGEKPVNMVHKREGDLLQSGVASWYGHPYHGRKTSNGETYNMWAMTAAHKTIPFGTWVRVLNPSNHREVIVRINDRGPFVQGRVIDLSKGAAEKLGLVQTGTANVKIFLTRQPSQDSFHPAEESKDPRPGSSVSSSKIWTIQIASFRDPSHAVELADQLASQFEGIRIEKANAYYRVRIGQFPNQEAASQVAKRLRQLGHEPWITQAP